MPSNTKHQIKAQNTPPSPSKYLLCPFCGHRSRQDWRFNKTCKNLLCPAADTHSGESLPLLYANAAKRENDLAPFTKENQQLLKEYRLEHGQRLNVELCGGSQSKEHRTHLYNRGYAMDGPGVGLQALIVPAKMMAKSIGLRTSSGGAAARQSTDRAGSQGEKKTGLK